MNEWGAVEPAAGIDPPESNGQVTEEVLHGNGWMGHQDLFFPSIASPLMVSATGGMKSTQTE